MKPFVTLTAIDEDDNELTSEAEYIVDTPAQAIELWQYLRAQAEKWLEKNIK